ncbi:MAG: molecular chaperone DnaJ [Candidatus Margulisiibacteriota bacterium]|nr:molecular chaperone DnaJ [Candidatus Margulisiibacteriota bacterium]
MANKRDFYEVLGVSKSSSADEIKRAYRKLARQYHPDVNKEAGSSEKFKEINEAYQVLSDPNKRSQYDHYGPAGSPGGAGGFGGFEGFGGGVEGFGEFGDLFDMFFGQKQGGRRRTQERGADLRYDLQITLKEAAKGIEKEIDVTHYVFCAACKGSGAKPGTKPQQCSTCKGAGQVKRSQKTILGNFTQVTPCPACNGSGQTISSPCESCRGEGRVKKSQKIRIKIPAGIDSGYRLRVSGAGDSGPRGTQTGDLYLFIYVEEHPLFNRDGANLYYRTGVDFTKAILGAEIKIPTLDGEATLKIPAGTQPNTNFRLKGKGLPVLNRRERGDLYVLVEIQIPKRINREQAELLKKYKNA